MTESWYRLQNRHTAKEQWVGTTVQRLVLLNTEHLANYWPVLLTISFYRKSFNEATRETATLDWILSKWLAIPKYERNLAKCAWHDTRGHNTGSKQQWKEPYPRREARVFLFLTLPTYVIVNKQTKTLANTLSRKFLIHKNKQFALVLSQITVVKIKQGYLGVKEVWKHYIMYNITMLITLQFSDASKKQQRITL